MLIAEPGRIIPVVGQVVTSQRVEKDIEFAAVENEKRQEFAELLGLEGDLIAPLRMRADRECRAIDP